MNDLAAKSGRAKSNLPRALRTMEQYGPIHFEEGPGRQLALRADYSGISLEVSF
ncbi:hypothetical protein [Bordetella bronchialis]|uniref:hypothetical protein n=1 Tax=Bordetella bronchialis TaxID=463025 RepID=UPI000B2E76EE|nr:hypothetical protein [Bordetella bronchialis]